MPADLASSRSCSAAGGGLCEASPPAGDLDESVDLPVGSTVTFTGDGVVSGSAGGFLVNTASIALPPEMIDPDPGNNAATATAVVLEIGS